MINRYTAEASGSFCLVTVGFTCVELGESLGLSPLGRSLIVGGSLGFAIAIVTFLARPISGAHLNPAVTLGCWLAGTMPGERALKYVIAQMVGGALAVPFLMLLASQLSPALPADLSLLQAYDLTPPRDCTSQPALAQQLAAAFIFVTISLGTSLCGQTRLTACLMIAVTLAALHIGFEPVANNAINPVRALGAPLAVDFSLGACLLSDVLVPLAGGVLAGIAARARLFIGQDPLDEDER